MLRIALVGNYNSSAIAHQAIPEALRLSGRAEGVWVATESITNAAEDLHAFDGIWCVPASPYKSTEGALAAIRYARESDVPFLGTCGGFQHAVLEYARNVCGLANADHAELDPTAPVQVITPLACSLVERTGGIILQPGSRAYKAYGAGHITEAYHCSYGLNPKYQQLFSEGPFHATGHDEYGEVRVLELEGHPFFVGTLFQSERRALKGEMPPIVEAFVEAVSLQPYK